MRLEGVGAEIVSIFRRCSLVHLPCRFLLLPQILFIQLTEICHSLQIVIEGTKEPFHKSKMTMSERGQCLRTCCVHLLLRCVHADGCFHHLPICEIIILYLCVFFSISFPESIGTEIEKKCQAIFPLQNVYIRKVKVLKKPKFDLTKLMEMHGDSAAEDTGAALDKIAAEKTVTSLAGAGGRL